jgi:BirA family biotin operon repressor/biotin-[acetyl-CoA-carboxylase] ligase
MNVANTTALGRPRLHLRRTDSTNERARALAIAGAPHGTLVTAAEQTAGRGRQGRSWVAPAGSALLCSLVLRNPPELLSLIAGVAVCDALGAQARVKWPNDVVIEVRDDASEHPARSLASSDARSRAGPSPETTLAKLAGILVEGRPQEDWTVLGIGVNVAVRPSDLPAELHGRAASLELAPSAIETTLVRVIDALRSRLAEPAETVLDAWRARDALRGREVSWAQGRGLAEGIDGAGRLIVTLADGSSTLLDAGEVHLQPTG